MKTFKVGDRVVSIKHTCKGKSGVVTHAAPGYDLVDVLFDWGRIEISKFVGNLTPEQPVYRVYRRKT